jgi:hypothetical protein
VMHAPPWAVLERPRRAPSEQRGLGASALDETRVMPIGEQQALARRTADRGPRGAELATPRRAPAALPRERR